jgi:hypothetical protein
LHVWVEPLEWDSEKGPCPIAQLDIAATNYLDEVEVDGNRAVFVTKLPCLSTVFLS